MAASSEFAGTGVHIGKIKFYADKAEGTIEVSPGSLGPGNKQAFYVAGSAKNMSQNNMDTYQRARLAADPANGGDIRTAKQMLEAAGFTVYWA